MNKPLKEHYEMDTDEGTVYRIFDYANDLEKYIESLTALKSESEPRGETAEEWLKKNYSEFIIHCNATGRSIPFFAKMLEEYKSIDLRRDEKEFSK